MTPGERVAGRYTIERELGRGGMGSVFLARDEKFGEKVAIKLAAASGVSHDEFRERFRREARIGNRLGRSEGFVRALDWGELDGARLYLVMDLVDGARPLDVVAGPLVDRLARVVTAAKLVAAAHAKGVVHRDLKPANFLVAKDGRVFLADFGLAKLQGDGDDATAAEVITRSGLGMGTPSFMPPEQFEDARNADERADVYALGVLLFLALTSKLPYEGSPSAIQKRQLRVQEGLDAPPRPSDTTPGVPAPLEALCGRALELDPAKRIADAGAFARELEAAAAGAVAAPTAVLAPAAQEETVRETPPPPAPPAPAVSPRRPVGRFVAAIGGVGVLVVLAGVFFIASMPEPQPTTVVEEYRARGTIEGTVRVAGSRRGVPDVYVAVNGAPAGEWATSRRFLIRGGQVVTHLMTVPPRKPFTIENASDSKLALHLVDEHGRTLLFEPHDSQTLQLEEEGPVEVLVDGSAERGWIVVTSNPRHAVTDGSGHFAIENAPLEEEVVVELWHPDLAAPHLRATVRPGLAASFDLGADQWKTPVGGAIVPVAGAPPDFARERSEFVVQLVGSKAERAAAGLRHVTLAKAYCTPRIATAMPGERLEIENRSGASCKAGAFEVRSGATETIRLASDLTLAIGDNAWGFVRVSDERAAITGDDGIFRLDIPRGPQKLRVWHPLMEEPVVYDVVADGAPVVVRLEGVKWRR